MKLYRNHRFDDDQASMGFTWFTSKREARRDAREDLGGDTAVESVDPIAEPFNIKLTRKGILQFLNLHASHPDNG